MPSERILNKLFEIAQENTNEEVNYNDFVKDILNSADLTGEDKNYNAEDEYLRNLLAFAKRDSRIFGEYKNGKFVISDSIINSAKKETQRNINVRKIKNDDLKSKGENASVFATIGEKIKNFDDLSLEDKVSLIRNTDDMTDEEFKDYTIKVTGDVKGAKKDGIITEEEAKDFEESMRIKSELRGKSREEKRKYIHTNLGLENSYIIKKVPRIFNKNDMTQIIDLHRIIGDEAPTYLKKGNVVSTGKSIPSGIKDKEEYISYLDSILEYIEDNQAIMLKKIYNARQKEQRHNESFKAHRGKITEELIEVANRRRKQAILGNEGKGIFDHKLDTIALDLYGDKRYRTGDEIEELEKRTIKQITDKKIEEKKATEDPALVDIGISDGGFEDLGLPASGDFMSAFREFGDASPVTDREFDGTFDIIEIGNTRTEEPRNADIVLEEEPEMDGENETRPSIIVEEINSDAIPTTAKQDERLPMKKLPIESVISFTKSNTKVDKVSAYFRKMKDMKEFAHAGIDNKSTEIGDIA